MRFLSPLFFLAALFAQESAEFLNWLNQGAQGFPRGAIRCRHPGVSAGY
jgi:hypothetical protein